jgi:hypothetical protein
MAEMVAEMAYQRGHWFVSSISEIRIICNITMSSDAHIMMLLNDVTSKVSVLGDIDLTSAHK